MTKTKVLGIIIIWQTAAVVFTFFMVLAGYDTITWLSLLIYWGIFSVIFLIVLLAIIAIDYGMHLITK